MGFLVSFFHRREKNSATTAKDRLLDVLIHDRVKLSPATMEQIRQEILGVLSKYMDVDREAMEVTLIRADGAHQLTAHVPIRRGETFNPMEPDGEEPPRIRPIRIPQRLDQYHRYGIGRTISSPLHFVANAAATGTAQQEEALKAVK